MDKKTILEKLAKGEISVEEAMRLEENQTSEATEVPYFKKNSRYKYLVIKVSTKGKNEKVNIRLPLALAKLAKSKKFKFGGDSSEANNIISELDIEEIIRIAEEEGTTKFVDIQTEEGENVEIYIE